MSFNPDPNKQAIEVIFSQKRNETVHPPLFFNNQIVSRINEHKHLGLTLDSRLSFTKHIAEKTAKARKGIGIIRYLSSYVTLDTLDQIYKLFVRPHLDYCDIIFHIPQKCSIFDSSINLTSLMNSLESTQYLAARAVSGTWKGTNTSKLYEELGWESLSDRRWFHRLLQFYKIFNNISSPYLKSIIPTPRTLLYGQRRENVLYELPCRTSRYQNSFFPDATKSWNNIGLEIRNIEQLSLFKKTLLSFIRPARKSFYNIRNPAGIKKLFRLRVGLSELKSHKKNHNFLDTPSDICDCGLEAEDTNHFFLRCPLYSLFRISFLHSTNATIMKYDLANLSPDDLVHIYLYGHPMLSKIDNVKILEASIRFVNESTRF